MFFLPSLCEGSATVCYEALAAGLPVITTPNAGAVIRHGIEGYIVPIRDVNATVECLERLALNPDLLAVMSEAAVARAAEFTIACYGRRLLQELSRCSGYELLSSHSLAAEPSKTQ